MNTISYSKSELQRLDTIEQSWSGGELKMVTSEYGLHIEKTEHMMVIIH